MAPEVEFFDNPRGLQKRNTVLGWLEKHSQGEVTKFVDTSTSKSAVIDDVNGEPVVILYEPHRTRIRFSEKVAAELKSAGIVEPLPITGEAAEELRRTVAGTD